MGAPPIPHEVLLRHAGFLRGLARDLALDAASSEDAVQEVWLRALRSPPRHDSNLRGWLRVLLTNFVRSKARADSRREIRERERALDPGLEVEAADARDEGMLRSVTESVLAMTLELKR